MPRLSWLTKPSIPVPDDFRGADLVGISAMTCDAQRAYQLAGMARARNIAVVLGGYHPTFMPEEAGEHADAVVRGFAETACLNYYGICVRFNAENLRVALGGRLRIQPADSPARLAESQGVHDSEYSGDHPRLRQSLYLLRVPPMHDGRYVQRRLDRIATDIDSMPGGHLALSGCQSHGGRSLCRESLLRAGAAARTCLPALP